MSSEHNVEPAIAPRFQRSLRDFFKPVNPQDRYKSLSVAATGAMIEQTQLR